MLSATIDVEAPETASARQQPRRVDRQGAGRWPLDTVEDSLGADAGRVLPSGMYLADLHVEFHASTCRCWSNSRRQDATKVSDIITRQLDAQVKR